MITDEELSRYIDGELAEEETVALRAAVAVDAGLAARLERLRAVDRVFTDAILKIDAEPMPNTLADLLTDQPVRTEARQTQDRALFAHSLRLPMAMAASLALGASAALSLAPRLGASSAMLAVGQIAASSRLADALDSTVSGASRTAGDAAVTPILSFRTADGLFCREFTWHTARAGAHAVACRSNGAWAVRVAADEPVAGGYKPASANAAIDAFVDGAMLNEPMTQAEERAFLTRANR